MYISICICLRFHEGLGLGDQSYLHPAPFFFNPRWKGVDGTKCLSVRMYVFI